MEIKVIETGSPNRRRLAYPVRNQLAASLRWIQNEGITTIGISSTFGWGIESNLDFLSENVWIEGIAILEDKIDLSPINTLVNLSYIGLSGNSYKGVVNLEHHKKILELGLGYNLANFVNLDKALTLKELRLYRWPYETLQFVQGLENLEWLEIYRSPKLKSLQGLEKLQKLYRLMFKSVPNLTDIGSLAAIAPSLKKLSFELAKKVVAFEVLDKLPNLESFYIFESAPIHSIQFLKSLKNLKYAYIGTEVLDGDVDYLEEKGIEYKKLKKYKGK